MPKLPETIGKYKITDRLGRGGMGLVYKALHPTLGTPVVLKKLMLKGDRAHRVRFRREAVLMMRIRHANIIGVYDHFKEGNAYYLVMEYVDGCPLSDMLQKEGALPPNEAAWIIGQTALALAHIHNSGIVHRDLKPANIMLTRSGDVKLGDFGIAFSPAESAIVTAEGTALGTPSYMAPEQLADARKADARSDVWSLGVCFFELLTDEKFVSGPTPAAIREALPRAVKTLSKRLPANLPAAQRRFLRKSLRIKPLRRPSGGAAAAQLLKASESLPVPEQIKGRVNGFLSKMTSAGPPKSPPEAAQSHANETANGSTIPEFPQTKAAPPSARPGGSEKTKKNTVMRTIRPRAFLAAALILALSGLLVIPGFRNELFRPDRYGRFRLELAIPAYGFGGVRARLYSADGEKEFPLPALRPSRDGLSMKSRSIFLPTGAYRLSWSLGDRIVWKSFYLGSIRENRARNSHPMIIRETLGEPPVFPLKLTAESVHALSGEALPAQLSWERLDEPGGELLSGGTYRVSLSAPGFHPETFTIAVSPWRRELALQAALWPLPVSISLRNLSERKILPRINGKLYYIDLAAAPVLSKLRPLPPGTELTLSLTPGEYIVSLPRGEKLNLTLAAGENATVDATEEGMRLAEEL
ncbi:MAG: hypothetical protein B0D92_02735 [Spirochaeta sp. LUC14_002_19_P3]|nr:MAG: hypothetical protein B0D92_02735 [Spirochaeta sp. LUC14_002_19_P3]